MAEDAVTEVVPLLRGFAAFGGPPVVWFVHLNVNYALVGPACHAGHRVFLHVVSGVAIAAALGCIALARARRPGASQAGDAAIFERLGVAMGWFFLLVIVAAAAANWMISPCA